MYQTSDLALSSKRKVLSYVEALYQFSDALHGPGILDDALFSIDVETLGELLEAYFVSIRNQPNINETAQLRWQTAFRFVNDIIYRLSKSNLPVSQLQVIKGRLDHLGTLYSQLRIGKKRTQDSLRALPSTVVEALYKLLDPVASDNPFRDATSRWRAFLVFILLLHQGLRRGELLMLASDAIKHGVDSKLGRDRYWLSVVENPYEDEDQRYSIPSIKTVNSIRQIPVSELTARIVQGYVENYRGKPAHSYLMNSQRGSPLSAESVTKLFQKITASLPASVLKDLKDRTGKISISAHDLRHTCAVVRLNQLLNQGDSMDEALQKMRTFFGWARSSDMPRKYARAVFEDRLASVWNNVFDDRVVVLRAIPEHKG
ncbi:tyrosine-type recombinase/integrase [Leeia sp. IMCC25680]|uniref:Tyrosine-type recombinase/integrase n=2 Tax=Leeia aquatica TaxID=2725557 RepID=A0A847S1U7_9NEIS|nr:tyrosine-type recombinase/integrase [Leeia aquatica]